jgi:hypothetical protein
VRLESQKSDATAETIVGEVEEADDGETPAESSRPVPAIEAPPSDEQRTAAEAEVPVSASASATK